MSTPATVPIFDPDGVLRDVPYEQMHDAIQAGGKPAVRFQAPDSKIRYVPADQTQDAVKAGGKVLPITEQAEGVPELYGFTPGHMLSNAWQGVKSVVSGAAALGKDIVTNPNWITGPTSTAEKFVFAPAREQQGKIQQAFERGDTSSAVGHAIASGLPLVGPWAASLGEQMGTGDIGGALAKGGAQVATPIAAGKAISAAGRVAAPLAGVAAERIYGSALKPSTAKFAPSPEALVRTGLESRIPISEAGVQKLSGLIDDLNSKIADTISADPTRTINKFDVTSRLGQTAQRAQLQVNPAADLEAISAAGNEFLGTQPGQIPVEAAQALKTGTYRNLKGRAYGELKSASIEAQKALARGIKEELATQFPELNNLNAAESKLINLDGADWRRHSARGRSGSAGTA